MGRKTHTFHGRTVALNGHSESILGKMKTELLGGEEARIPPTIGIRTRVMLWEIARHETIGWKTVPREQWPTLQAGP